MPILPEPLRHTLEMVADLAAPAHDPWWIIASAAVALHGAPVSDVRDVDLLMNEPDARRTLVRAGVEPRSDQGSKKFRSAVFGTWLGASLPVEIFGGFEFAGFGGWKHVLPETREPIAVGDKTLFVPSTAELRAMLIGFGRPKDLARAELLHSP
jgi:hypothetical protein